jgi:lactate permease
MLGALAGLLAAGIWAVARRSHMPTDERPALSARQVFAQMRPYLLLLGIIFAVTFIPFLNDALNRWAVQIPVPALTLRDGTQIPASQTKRISILGHPGAQLVYAALITVLIARLQDRLPPGSGAQIRQGVLQSGVKSSLGILAMMAMATTMQTVGMVSALSSAMASVAGQAFPLISPFIGALGAFMTGSNTNSNVLLGAFQLQVGQALGLRDPLVLALHNAGAAVGSVFSPAKIIVGCSTVGLSGGESEALKRTSRTGLLIIALVAVLGMAVTYLLAPA